jgi:hypothetical protein
MTIEDVRKSQGVRDELRIGRGGTSHDEAARQIAFLLSTLDAIAAVTEFHAAVLRMRAIYPFPSLAVSAARRGVSGVGVAATRRSGRAWCLRGSGASSSGNSQGSERVSSRSVIACPRSGTSAPESRSTSSSLILSR